MPIESNNPKGRFWEGTALPEISTLSPGVYTNPQITVDEFGRVTAASSGGGASGVGAQDSGAPIAGGPFNVINLLGSNITGTLGAANTLDITVSSSGSISALDEGIAVPGGPFTSINVLGSDAVATDGGGGQLDLTIVSGGGPRHQFVKDTIGAATQNVGGPVNASGVVREVTVSIITPYSGGATIEVQDSLGGVLMASGLINPQLAGTYVLVTPENTAAIGDPQVVAVVGGAPALGNAVVEVIYQTG